MARILYEHHFTKGGVDIVVTIMQSWLNPVPIYIARISSGNFPKWESTGGWSDDLLDVIVELTFELQKWDLKK